MAAVNVRRVDDIDFAALKPFRLSQPLKFVGLELRCMLSGSERRPSSSRPLF